jgi:inosose dehydratase
MTIKIGNAPCSWGVEFADDPRNPAWQSVLDECKAAGYDGIELGPIGFMPEDPAVLGDALAARGLQLIGGVLFRPFHDPAQWDAVKDAAVRTCKSLVAHGAQHLVLIDSISPRRAPTAGRPKEAERMSKVEWDGFASRFRDIAQLGSEEYGLTVSLHPHAAGFMDFEAEVERLLDDVDARLLKLCLDTGHTHYAGFDPVAFMKRHRDRLAYVHFKDIDPVVKADVVSKRTDFYKACGQGVFCNLGQGMTDFRAVRKLLLDTGYDGWCTVEQDCDPAGSTSPIDDARANRAYLRSIDF